MKRPTEAEYDSELNRLRRDLAQAATDLQYISKWREECHEHDADMGYTPRDFDEDTVKLIEKYAKDAAKKYAKSAGRPFKP